MVKRLLYRFSPQDWGPALAVYGKGRLWQEVWHQAGRSRWAEGAAAVAFLWLLGLLVGSFVVLHLAKIPGVWLPPGGLEVARSLQASLAIPAAEAGAEPIGRWGLGLAGLGAWVSWVAGTQKLLRWVGEVYGDRPESRQSWRSRLLPWGVALLGLGLGGAIVSLVGPASTLADSTLTGAGLARRGEYLARWGLALGSLALGLALVYRFTPRRWRAGLPLWPGVRLALVLGLGIFAVRGWCVGWLTGQAMAYAPLLTLALNLLTLYGLIVLVPVGAQVNLSALHHRGTGLGRTWGSPPAMAPPPSFDSFKIKRRD
jgi:hypothetical protein